MGKLAEHPTVVAAQKRLMPASPQAPLSAAALRARLLEAGADDVGFVSLDREEIAPERDEILHLLPGARTLVSFVRRMNPSAMRSPPRSLANLEFHHTGDAVNEIAAQVLRELARDGVRGVNPAMGFPMEMDRFPGKVWVVSHKRVAEAAGLGIMGIHRNVIHPRFGNFILLGTLVIDRDVDEEGGRLDFNPCLECKLCVAACPTGAIASDGRFDFSACYTHNYREFMGGFTDWVEQVADSKDAKDYRGRVGDSESASMWQSLSFGANYKAAYCIAVCPAGEDVIGPFLRDRKRFQNETLKPLQQQQETVYVLEGSDAKDYAAKRFPHKPLKVVNNSLRSTSIAGFVRGLPLLFQPGQAGDLACVYHFRFSGKETVDITVRIAERRIEVQSGLHGDPDLEVQADSAAWLAYLRKDAGLAWPLLSRRIRVHGPMRLLRDFGGCFPG